MAGSSGRKRKGRGKEGDEEQQSRSQPHKRGMQTRKSAVLASESNEKGEEQSEGGVGEAEKRRYFGFTPAEVELLLTTIVDYFEKATAEQRRVEGRGEKEQSAPITSNGHADGGVGRSQSEGMTVALPSHRSRTTAASSQGREEEGTTAQDRGRQGASGSSSEDDAKGRTMTSALDASAAALNAFRLSQKLPSAERTRKTCSTKFYSLRREYLSHVERHGKAVPISTGALKDMRLAALMERVVEYEAKLEESAEKENKRRYSRRDSVLHSSASTSEEPHSREGRGSRRVGNGVSRSVGESSSTGRGAAGTEEEGRGRTRSGQNRQAEDRRRGESSERGGGATAERQMDGSALALLSTSARNIESLLYAVRSLQKDVTDVREEVRLLKAAVEKRDV